MYAERKGWDLQAVEVRLEHSRFQAADESGRKSFRDEIRLGISMTGDLEPAQRRRLMEISKRCRVHRTLQSEVALETVEVVEP